MLLIEKKMAKKSIILLTLICLGLVLTIVSFAVAQTDIVGVTPEQQKSLEQIQAGVEKIPITEEGKVDTAKIMNWTTPAEVRIAKINAWLERNVSWISFVFGMKPAISWLFAFNLFLMLSFFSLCVFALPKALNFGSSTYITAAGVILFLILVFTKAIYSLANMIMSLWGRWYIKLALVLAAIGLFILTLYLERYLGRLGIVLETGEDRSKLKAGAKIFETIQNIAKKTD
jgi:hypothetical protein